MISAIILRAFQFRVRLMRISANNLLIWDPPNLKIKRTLYRVLNGNLTLLFFTLHGLHAVLYSVNFLTGEHGADSDYHKELVALYAKKIDFKTNQSMEESILGFIGFIHIVFAAIFIFVFCLLYAIRVKLEPYKDLFNKLVGNDMLYQSVYETQLASNARAFRLRFIVLNVLGIGIAFSCTVVPLLFGVFALQPLSPLRKLIVEVLEIYPRIEIKFIPLMLFISYVVFEVADVAFLLIYLALMYLTSTEFWMRQLCPKFVSETSNRSHQTDTMLRCRIGCDVGANKLLRFYKHYQILTNAFNNTYAFSAVSVHHVSALLLLVSALYILIRYPSIMYIPGGGQLIPAGVVLLCILEYCEAIFMEGVYQSSVEFLAKLKGVTETFAWRNNWNRKVVQRELTTCRPLQPHTAYPYFSLNRQNFLSFVNTAIDFLVNLLVMTGKDGKDKKKGGGFLGKLDKVQDAAGVVGDITDVVDLGEAGDIVGDAAGIVEGGDGALEGAVGLAGTLGEVAGVEEIGEFAEVGGDVLGAVGDAKRYWGCYPRWWFLYEKVFMWRFKKEAQEGKEQVK
ncbi:hypothetical protein Ocin01_09221 [Orchesella cincta]|uniref:Uncharacterized protein n=1 Tax=Orchesella cincta TaxID=48709 RepID=A0A1D2MWX3_ORCCI|nr:hypothetical protein Ocin01_09221 [Orchesella cincta]